MSNGTSYRRLRSIYQIMVDRFYDGDPSNNYKGEAFRFGEETEEDFRYLHGGDWQGIIDKMDYITGMGYEAIWISPITDQQLWGMPDANGKQWPCAYHGYNVYDPNRASRYFGKEDPEKSKQKLKELVEVCHANGLKVIFDIVPNHMGDYLQGSGENTHYISADGLKEGTQVQPARPFNNLTWYHNKGDIDFSREHPHNQETTQMLENYDLGGLDDIDFDNPEAKKAVFDSIKYWFTYTGADAARVDAAKCMKVADIHELQEYLGVPTFGENFDMCVSFVKDWVGENAENGMLDFPLFQAIVNDFAYGLNFNNTSELSIQAILDQDGSYGSHVNDMVTFLDNHDRNRFLTEASGDVEKLQNALMFLFAVRGIPTIFQGTEQNRGNANGQKISGIADTWNRWSMVTKDPYGNVIHDYFQSFTDTYYLIQKLNELRRDYVALREGTQREMWTSMHTYAFSRRMDVGEQEGQEIIGVFHNCPGRETVTMSIRAESSIISGTTLQNVFDPNDQVRVSSDRKITVTVEGNHSKIYAPVLEEAGVCTVTISVNHAFTRWGQNVYLVGNCSWLGNWNPAAAVGPGVCPHYPTWSITVKLPMGLKIAYKMILKDESGNVTWQSGANRTYTVPYQKTDFAEIEY